MIERIAWLKHGGPPKNAVEAALRAAWAGGGGETVKTVTGSIVSIADAKAGAARSILVSIVPSQSGTPSAENPVPITGLTGASVTVCGKNIFDKGRFSLLSSFALDTDPESAYYGYYRGNAQQLGTSSSSVFNVSYTDPSKAGFVGKTPIGELPVTVSLDYKGAGSNGYTRFYYADGSDSGNAYRIDSGTEGHGTYSKPSSNIFGINFRTTGGSSSKIALKNVQIEVNASETEYEDYSGTTHPIDWTDVAGTVYGGTLDVTNGKLTVTHASIASYAGEAINEPWLSSMDVYSAGGTPTTGAQVVYPLTTPTEVTLTPTEIVLFLGTNNVWSDGGNTTLTYAAGD